MPSVAIPATYLPTDKISPSSPSINYSASVDTSLQENSMDFGDLDLEKVLRGDFYKPSRKSPRLKMRPNDSKPNFYQSNFVDLNHINEQLMESNKKSENKEYQLINPNQNQSIPWANDSNQNGLNVSLTSTEFPTTKPISGRASSNDSVNSARSDIDKIMDEFHDLMEEIQHTEATADVHTPLKKPKRIIDNYLSCNKHSNSSSCHKENSNEHNESIKQSSSFVDVVSNNVKQHLRGSQHQHDKYTTSFEARKFDEKYNSGRNISEMVHYNHDSSNSAIQATWSAEQAPRSQHAIYDTLETADSSKSYALRSRGGVIASSYNEINLKPNEQLRSSALQEKGIHDVYSPPFPTSNHINSSADIDDFVIEGLREMQKTANREDYLILQKEIDRILNINTISSDNQDTDFVDSCDNTSNSVKESEKATETPITSNLKYSSSEYDLAASSKVRKEPKSYKDFEENTEEKRSVRSSNSSISHADSLANSIDASFEEVEGNKIELDKYESDVALQIKQSNDGSDTKKRRLGDVFHSKFVESTKVVLPSEKDLVGCSSIDDSSTKRYLMGLTASVGSLDEAIENEKDNISRSNNRKSTDPLEALYFSTDRKVIPATVPTGESGRIEPLKNESVLDPKNYEANIPQGFDSILAAEQEIEMLKRTNSSLMESLREERNARLKLENVHKASQVKL